MVGEKTKTGHRVIGGVISGLCFISVRYISVFKIRKCTFPVITVLVVTFHFSVIRVVFFSSVPHYYVLGKVCL